jgi:drug/metabolite transporter (DMT)-like permease
MAAVFTLTPAISAVAGLALLGQRVTPRLALALAAGTLGALWVIFRADLGAVARLAVGPGEALFLAGCVAHGVYPAVSRRLTAGDPPVATTFGMLLAGWLLLGLWGWRAILETDWMHLRPLVWATLLYLSAVSGAATFLLIQYAVTRLPAAKVMAYTYLTPAFVALWELALGHGTPPPAILAGVAATILALALLLAED